jgi:hypothetical protein
VEITDLQLVALVVAFFIGVFGCRFATHFFEVCHAAILVEKTVYHCLLMCAKVHEDLVFLREIKLKHLKEGEFTTSQVREFQEVDGQILTNWKESIIQSMLISAPPSFGFTLKFTNWREAMEQLREMRKES